MNVFDGLKVPSRGLVFNDSSWQFAYQAIGGLRYDINPVLILDLDYPLSGDDRIDIPDSQYGPPLPHGRQHEQFRGEPDLPVRLAADQCPVDAGAKDALTRRRRSRSSRISVSSTSADLGHETRRIPCLLIAPVCSTPCPAGGDAVRGDALLGVAL